MKQFVVTLGIVLLTASIGSTKTIHVPGDSSTIQAGINGSVAGDTVLVASGVYTGEGNKNLDFLGKAIVVRSENEPEATVIDCEDAGRGFNFHSSEDCISILEGFTILGGNMMGALDTGGGILCDNSSPTIKSCIISENSAQYGGGIYCGGNCAPLIIDCIIAQNWGFWGGGVNCEYSSPICSNCVIKGNRGKWGGGIMCFKSQAIFTKCIISENEVHTYGTHEAAGGGIHSWSSFPTIENCIISNNKAMTGSYPPLQQFAWGGGISCDGARIVNCAIVRNVAGDYAGGVSFEAPLDVTGSIVNSIVWDNKPDEVDFFGSEPDIKYSDIKGGWPGEGNIDEDPLFRDPDNDDFHLMATYCGDPYDSPCIDMGDPNISDDSLDCWHGLGTDRSDIGAYGGSNSGWPTAVEEDEDETPHIPKEFVLHQNYPNPFNSKTVLSYSVPQSGRVTFSVYNVLGQQVATLFGGGQETGLHNIVWDAAHFSSGIYFARLEAGGHSKTVKMILLK